MNKTTVVGSALQKALDAKKNDYSNLVWKGAKIKEGDKFVQESEKLIDMSPERLQECWNHCEIMLHNDDPKHLGRYNVLEEVLDQINNCNVELLLRYCENSYLRRENQQSVRRFMLMIDIRKWMNDSEVEQDWSTVPVSRVMNVPDEFNSINISDTLKGCQDSLGAFNKQHLTMTFITKMGLWFSKAEENEFQGTSNIERLKEAKERLHLPTRLVLRFSEKGLSFHEMRAMLTLPKKQKYSDMTTEQLLTLRNKVLLRLSKEIDAHIYSWKKLQKQIEMVAKQKGIILNND